VENGSNSTLFGANFLPGSSMRTACTVDNPWYSIVVQSTIILVNDTSDFRMVSVNGDRLSLQPATTMTVAASDPAEARKRRKEIIQAQRTDGNEPNSTTESSPPAAAAAAASAGDATSVEDAAAPPASVPATKDKKPPKKRKVVEEDLKDDEDESGDSTSKKAQIRYDPDIPMSKEQLAAWRREARRVSAERGQSLSEIGGRAS
jgi:hypothetical protein